MKRKLSNIRYLIALSVIALLAVGCVLTPAPSPTPVPPKPAAPAPTVAPAAPAPTTAPAKPAAPAPTTAPAAKPAAPAATAAPAAKPAATTAPAPAVKAPPIPTTPVEIVFWGWTQPPHMEMIEQRMKEYTAKHPNVKFTVDNVSYTDLEKKLLVSFGTGTGPDMFAGNVSWLPPYVEKNNLAAFSPEALGYPSLDAMKEAYLPGALDPFIRDGKLLILPYYFYSLGLFVNTNHFKEAGLDAAKDYPKTWDEVLTVGKKLAKMQGDKLARQGFKFQFFSPVWTQMMFEPLIRQYGADTLGPDGKCAMNSPAGVKAMDFIAALKSQKVMDPAVSVATTPMPTLDFPKEVASMMPGHPTTVDFVRSENPTMWNDKSFAVVPLPQADPKKPVTHLGGNILAISAAASPDKLAVARDFAREYTARPGEWVAKLGAMAPIKTLVNAPEAKSFPYLDVFVEGMKYGRLTTWSKYTAEVAAAERRALEAVLLNNVGSKQALDQACQEVNRALGF